MTTQVLNINILNIRETELQEQLDALIADEGNGSVLITPNLDHLVKLQKDFDFYTCYKQADFVICDSMVLYYSSKLLHSPFPTAISGSSFFTHFYERHSQNPSCRIFLLGAMGDTAQHAKAAINKKVGRDIIVGAYSPSWGFETKQQENEEIYKMIQESGANVVLVGVGAPKQEKWIFAHKEHMPDVKIWLALGATIDFEAGEMKRAPMWMRRCALEWFYRLLLEPRRMFKRYICDDLMFFVHFAKQLMGTYKNPFE